MKAHYNQTGFTLVEVLVVVAILGVLVAVAGVGFGKYIGTGQSEAQETELQNIQTAVSAMLHDSEAGKLDSAYSDISDMDLVTADSGAYLLSSYLKNLDSDGNVLTGCTYNFTVDGEVTQASTP